MKDITRFIMDSKRVKRDQFRKCPDQESQWRKESWERMTHHATKADSFLHNNTIITVDIYFYGVKIYLFHYRTSILYNPSLNDKYDQTM